MRLFVIGLLLVNDRSYDLRFGKQKFQENEFKGPQNLLKLIHHHLTGTDIQFGKELIWILQIKLLSSFQIQSSDMFSAINILSVTLRNGFVNFTENEI